MKLIKFIIVCFILIFVVFQFNSDAYNVKNTSNIPIGTKSIVNTICKKAMLVKLSDLDPEIRKYMDKNQLSYNTKINADFNNDKLLDYALLVTCKSNEDKSLKEKLIVLLQKKTGGYNIFVLEEFPKFMDDLFIIKISPAEVKEFGSNAKIAIRNNGIGRVFDEKSSGIYYWRNNRFYYVQISD